MQIAADQILVLQSEFTSLQNDVGRCEADLKLKESSLNKAEERAADVKTADASRKDFVVAAAESNIKTARESTQITEAELALLQGERSAAVQHKAGVLSAHENACMQEEELRALARPIQKTVWDWNLLGRVQVGGMIVRPEERGK